MYIGVSLGWSLGLLEDIGNKAQPFAHRSRLVQTSLEIWELLDY